jgi:alpha-tubulin suppressor-like RCC1 family protein
MIDGLPVELDIASWSGGHAIVVDGWQSEGRVYHLNFGKGGSHSGWYSLPEGMPAGYSVVRYAVTNIRPPSPAGTGDVYGFGLNSYGELGLGDTTERHTPAKIATLSGEARAVAAGDSHSLVLLENGDVYSFGSNIDAVLGLGDWIPHYTPTKITTLPGPAAAVAAGYKHSLVLLQNGDVYTFGWNQLGQLGLGDTSQSYSPRRITTLPGAAVAVAGGYAHSLVVLDNGDVYTFGLNQFGQLGLGDTTERHTPTKITTLPAAATAVAGGQWHSLVLLENGDVYGFGSNSHGALGLGDTTERHTPTKITTLPVAATAVAGGTSFSLVLLENGDVYAFGLNSYGQLGLGDTTERHTPAKIATLSGEARAVAAGDSHSLVLLENGDVYGFGRNSYGQLGLGDTTERHTPTKIATLSGAVATGEDHSFAVLGAPPSPFAPSDVVASDGAYASKVRVAWNVASGATLYVVHRTAGPHETFVEIAELTGNSYDDSHVTPGRIYWYKVAACSGSGCSDLSAADSGYAGNATGGTPAAFRVTTSGDMRADGGLYAGNLFLGSADVAEWVLVSNAVEPGTVLELDTTDPGSYRPSQASCSSLLAGVVSTLPGITLGTSTVGPQQALLALSGIVPVKVTNEGGPIQPGDLLVSSSAPGYAMRWAGPEPCPCALVGKALESMTGDRGVISVLLTAH